MDFRHKKRTHFFKVKLEYFPLKSNGWIPSRQKPNLSTLRNFYVANGREMLKDG